MRLPLLLLALLALLWSPPARAATPAWQVTEVAGDVRLQTADGVRPARRGASLAAGEAIVTGAGGRAVLTRGTEFVIVSPGTRLRLPGADRPGGIVQMLQDFGTAVYRIQKKMTPHFGVQTPYLAAVVKGTTFRVEASDKGASVKVLEGRVEVATGNGHDTRMAVPGLLVAVSAGQPDRLSVSEDKSAARATGNGRSENATAKADRAQDAKADGEKVSATDKRNGKADRTAEAQLNGNGNARGAANADSARDPRQDGPGGDERNGAVVTRTPGEKAALVRLPEAARNAQPPKGNGPDTDPNAPKPDKEPKPEKEPDAPKPDKKDDTPKPDAPKPDKEPDAPKPDAPKPDAPKPVAPKPDEPKVDQPKPDAPKPDAPKVDEPAPVKEPEAPPPPPPPPAAPSGDDDDDDDDEDDRDDDDDSGSLGALREALAPLPIAAPAPAPDMSVADAIPAPLSAFAGPTVAPALPAAPPPPIVMDGALGLERLLAPRL